MSEITRELARFTCQTRFEDIPPHIVTETKHVIMDSIGCALGALSTDKGKIMAALGRRYGGPEESSIIGLGDRVSCNAAALTNGELMITLDYHDIIAGGHDGVYVLPTVLAIAETVDASGKDLILATAVGLEISARIARAKPGLQTKITDRLLNIDKTSQEHKDLIKAGAIESFSEYFEESKDKNEIIEFVKKQLNCESPKTRKKAKEFLKKWCN